MKTLTRTLIISLPFILTGCFENRTSTKQICEQTPELHCERLNSDGQCRVARTDLIWHRVDELKNPSDENLIKEYHLVSAYQTCMDLAAQIEPTKADNKKEGRFNALNYTYEEQKRLMTLSLSDLEPLL